MPHTPGTAEPAGVAPRVPAPRRTAPGGETRARPARDGRAAARSGDKGGNANVGLWARDRRRSSPGCADTLTVDGLRALLPEAAGLTVRRYELPNLRALNFVVVGLLGEGVASSTRPDPQAKGLGEYLRSRHVDVPVALLSCPS